MRQRAAYLQTQWLVRAFYLATVIVAFQAGSELYATVNEEIPAAIQWPVFWIRWVPPITAARVLIVLLFISAVACVLYPASRAARIALPVALLEVVGLRFSFGYFHHYLHIWLWLAAIFAAFPVDPKWRETLGERPARRQQALAVFFLAQVMVAMFYTLSGLWKVARGFITPPDYMSSFSVDALPAMVLERWINNPYPAVLQDVFVNNLWLGMPAHLCVMYVETFALVAVFRPAMHRPFGLVLLFFHMMVWLLMGIAFWYQPAQLALLFVFSPFAASTESWRTDVRQLPVIGDLIALWRPRRELAHAMTGRTSG
jgi:hypothetical protein